MENKPIHQHAESGVPVEKYDASHCAQCGTTNIEKVTLSLMDQLIRSHAELSAALRWAGRQMLRFERHDHHSLERVRGPLRRAENVRRTLSIPNELPEDPSDINDPPADTQAVYSDGNLHVDGPPNKILQSKGRLSRSHDRRVLRFPAI